MRVPVYLLLVSLSVCGAADAQRIRWNDAEIFSVDADGNVLSSAPFTPIEHIHQNRPVNAEILWLETPLNRAKNNGETVRLPVLRLKSQSDSPKPPLVFLQGGPGDSAINAQETDYLAPIITQALKDRDVILMDQRGVGRARPPALWASVTPLPLDMFLSEDIALAEMRKRHEGAKAHFEKRGLDLSGFNSVEAADDIEALRIALNADKIQILGFSYGTHLSLVILRRHGDRIDRAVLVGTEGLNDTFKLPLSYDEQLDKLSKVVAADPVVGQLVPDMKASWKRILDRAKAEPYRVPIESRGEEIELPFGPFGLQWIVRRDLGDTNDLPYFPALFYTLENGDVSIFRQYVQRRYGQYGTGVHGMGVMTDIASNATADRIAEIERQIPIALFGNTMNFPDFELREVWGNPDLGDAFRQPVVTDVPSLFISGTLDCQTPPEQADAARAKFANSAHIVVENAGHENLLPIREVQNRIIAFLNGGTPTDEALRFDLKFNSNRTAGFQPAAAYKIAQPTPATTAMHSQSPTTTPPYPPQSPSTTSRAPKTPAQ